MSHPVRMIPKFGLAFRPMKGTFQLSPALPHVRGDEKPATLYHATLSDGVANVERALIKLASFYDIINIESSVALNHSVEEKKSGYEWAQQDSFPPHLAELSWTQELQKFTIFDPEALLQTLNMIFEGSIPDWLGSAKINFMQDIVDLNKTLHKKDEDRWFGWGDMYDAPNVGLRDDWYTDAVFAQQHLTGPNPTTIKLAKEADLKLFRDLATGQQNAAMLDLLSTTDGAFYIQDYGDFRDALGIGQDAELVSEDGMRYGCAACCLFKMSPNGTLHPLAIIIDQKGSDYTQWPVLFNRRLTPDDVSVDQKSDWPWRYAKTCVLTSDWLRHEVTVHLTETHLLEEAIIVAAQRTLPNDNDIMTLLERIWTKTLSLNSLARSTLVPSVIAKIVGFPSSAVYPFMQKAYRDFDWTGRYVPNDLRNRGFPPERLNEPMFHNCGYARCINDVWSTLRKFVKAALQHQYPNDEKVAGDRHLQDFCFEMRKGGGGQLDSFPESLKTVDEVVDVVTMIMHIASPQHTAVNYLQQYYQTFIANKPSALFSRLPDADKLKEYTEQDVLAALPIRAQKEWLLMAQLPYLLSFRVAGDENILSYAKSLYRKGHGIGDAAKQFHKDLLELGTLTASPGTFNRYNDDLDDKETGYTVLYSDLTAESILI